MKTLKKIITTTFIAAAMFGTASAHAQTSEAQIRANLNEQLKVLLVQLIEKLQLELALLKEQENQSKIVGDYIYSNLDGDISYDIKTNKVEINVNGTFADGCSTALQPTLKAKNKTFDIKLLERKAINADCTDAEESYELDFDIDTRDLKKGKYTVKINGVKEFTFMAEGEKALPLFGNDDISARVLSSSSATPNDTASFKFTVQVAPFDDPIYIPVAAANSVSFDIIDASTNSDAGGTSTVSLSSSAKKVDGNDGNEYFKLSSSKKMTVNITTQPGVGDYFATLDGIKFSNQNVTDSSFTHFSPIKINLSDDVWRTDTVTLLN